MAALTHAADYTTIPPNAEGIGKVYMGRQIAHVMTWHGADWLERAERTREERPDLVLAALPLKPGMIVADIGTGSGYYARRMAERVGPGGVVYATDIQPEMLQLLEQEASARGIANIKPVLATKTDPKLAPQSIDLAVMVDVYHELEFPHETLAGIVRALKPGGRIAFVEFRANDPKVPIRTLHTMSEEQIRTEAAVHPLEFERTVRGLPWQHVVIFRVKTRVGPHP